MSKNTVDTRTPAIVLRRTNYGEADRILNLITPDGKVAAIARGVRKAKSKLAGGVEMFSLIEVNLHFGRGELATITGARSMKFYSRILSEYARMELAASILKKINVAAEAVENREYFEILKTCLEGLDNGMDLALVESWFLLNLLKASGEEVNLYRDNNGEKLSADERYYYDAREMVFVKNDNGEFGVDEIKILRLMETTQLVIVAKVKNIDKKLPEILRFARLSSKML